jgi:argininosuccinate lyase
MKGQPLAYNKDNQEDKEPLFDTVDTVVDSLVLFAEMMRGIIVKPARMREAASEGFATATDLADYLVRRGTPFREAHEAVARAVREAARLGIELSGLTLDQFRAFAPSMDASVYDVLTLDGSLASRNHFGGTAPAQVRAAVARARQDLAVTTEERA